MSEFVPALAEHSEAFKHEKIVASKKVDYGMLTPTKGFSEIDIARKEIAKDLSVAKRYQDRNRAPRKRKQKCQLGDTHEDVRKFHNSVKVRLYNLAHTYADLENNRFPSILELACGRGGDLHKWKKTGFKNVIAVDYDPNAIDEAMERVKKIETKPMRIKFSVVDLSKPGLASKIGVIKGGNPTFDVVSMHFAIQYLCEQVNVLERFLRDVAFMIKPGGCFVGSYPDAGEISKLLQSTEEPVEVSQPLQHRRPTPSKNSSLNECPRLGIANRNSSSKKNFDNGFLKIHEFHDMPGISFHADFGTDSYFEAFGTSTEYPVMWEHIVKVLDSFGLVLVKNTSFPAYSEVNGFILTEQELQFSRVFKSFVFQKRKIAAFFPSPCPMWDALKIDDVGRYSVTKPQDAKKLHEVISKKGPFRSACDGTACVGADTLYLSSYCKEVFSWEINEERYLMLTQNIEAYGVKNVTTQNASFLKSSGDCDLLYLDPPWGGKGYDKAGAIEMFLDGRNIKDVIKKVRERFGVVAVKIPHNYNINPTEEVVQISNKISVWFVR